MTLKLSRHEVCDLLIALAAAKDASNAKRWEELHDRIRSMLANFDKELDKEMVYLLSPTGCRFQSRRKENDNVVIISRLMRSGR